MRVSVRRPAAAEHSSANQDTEVCSTSMPHTTNNSTTWGRSRPPQTFHQVLWRVGDHLQLAAGGGWNSSEERARNALIHLSDVYVNHAETFTEHADMHVPFVQYRTDQSSTTEPSIRTHSAFPRPAPDGCSQNLTCNLTWI